MELIRGIHNLRPRHRGCVATIGNYDGVHLGHQAVLDSIIEVGTQLGLPSTVMAFEPTPQEFFAAERAPARLTRFREKYNALAGTGVDRFLCLRFDRAFSELSPDAFVSASCSRVLASVTWWLAMIFDMATSARGILHRLGLRVTGTVSACRTRPVFSWKESG